LSNFEWLDFRIVELRIGGATGIERYVIDDGIARKNLLMPTWFRF